MTYVMSNIHGQWKKYKKMLEKISFRDTDFLYILGDVIDYGEHSIEVLNDMSYRMNVYPIIGDHEFYALKVLKKIMKSGAPDNSVKADMLKWLQNGGQSTFESFMKLPDEEKEGIIEYLEEFSAYDIAEVNDKTYILVHSGISDFDEEKNMDDYDIEDLIFDGATPDTKYFDDKTVIAGHTPTYELDENSRGKIIKKDGIIFIDCGAAFDEPLGCLCLETGKEFYVD